MFYGIIYAADLKHLYGNPPIWNHLSTVHADTAEGANELLWKLIEKLQDEDRLHALESGQELTSYAYLGFVVRADGLEVFTTRLVESVPFSVDEDFEFDEDSE